MSKTTRAKSHKTFRLSNFQDRNPCPNSQVRTTLEWRHCTRSEETLQKPDSSNTIGVVQECTASIRYYFSIVYTNLRSLTRCAFCARLKDISLLKNLQFFISHSWLGLALGFVILTGTACAVRRTTKVATPVMSAPLLEASANDLIGRANALGDHVRTLTATVEFQKATAGSAYTGVIKEYRDVKGFILVKKPAFIRVIGQAPVIRTNIFDMVSNGETFRLNIPPKHKFIEGSTAFTRPAKNSLENIRPQHILEALLVPPIDAAKDKLAFEEAEEAGRRFYVLTIFQSGEGETVFPLRKMWFDRSNLDVARLQLYGPKGNYIEDVRYSNYQDYAGTRYPSLIQIARPVEDYSLAIAIQKATFNQEITPDKFELKKPEGADLVELSVLSEPEVEHGK